MPLTLEEYEKLVYDIPNQFPSVRYSTSPTTNTFLLISSITAFLLPT
jgi:hypothetical protein